MFDDFESRQVRRRDWRPFGIVGAVISVGLALVRCALHEEERRSFDRSMEMANLAMPEPPEPGSYHRVELPGMSLELPTDTRPTGTYSEGQLTSFYPMQIDVSWTPGGMPDADLRRAAATRMAKLGAEITDDRELEIGGRPGRQLTIALAGVPSATAIFTTCGGRTVAIAIGGSGLDVVTARAIASFRCAPDPAKIVPPHSDVVVDALPGWSQVPVSGLVLADGHGLRAVAYANAPQDDEATVADVILRGARDSGAHLDGEPATRGDKVVFTGTDKTGSRIAILAWRCDARIAQVIAIAEGDARLERGIELAATGRCIAASDPMPRYPMATTFDYEVGSKLVRVHYPADFIASPGDDPLLTTFIEPMVGSLTDSGSLIAIATNPHPVTTNLEKYANILQDNRAKKVKGYAASSRLRTTCWHDLPGIETRWTYLEDERPMRARACMFVHHGHGYSFMYGVPIDQGDDAEPKLRAIVDAAELTD